MGVNGVMGKSCSLPENWRLAGTGRKVEFKLLRMNASASVAKALAFWEIE